MDAATVSVSSAFPHPAQRMSAMKTVAIHARVPMRAKGAKAGPRQPSRVVSGFSPDLLPDEFFDRSARRIGDVDVALLIERDAVRTPSDARHPLNRLAVLHDGDRLRIDVAHVKRVVGRDVHRATWLGHEVGPLLEELA